jgi:hypothetical protein
MFKKILIIIGYFFLAITFISIIFVSGIIEQDVATALVLIPSVILLGFFILRYLLIPLFRWCIRSTVNSFSELKSFSEHQREYYLKSLSKNKFSQGVDLNSMSDEELKNRAICISNNKKIDFIGCSYDEVLNHLEGLRQERDALVSKLGNESKPMVCRNCGHTMGFFQKTGTHGGIFGNPCEKLGKKCVSI